jgi:hypothetical protein
MTSKTTRPVKSRGRSHHQPQRGRPRRLQQHGRPHRHRYPPLQRRTHARAGPRRAPSPRMPHPSPLPISRLVGVSPGVGKKTPARAAPTMNSPRPCACRTWTLLDRLSGPRLLRRRGLRTRHRTQPPWRVTTWWLPRGSGVIGAEHARPMAVGIHHLQAARVPAQHRLGPQPAARVPVH